MAVTQSQLRWFYGKDWNQDMASLPLCCWLWIHVCVDTKFICQNSDPQCKDDIWRCGLWEVTGFRWGCEGGSPRTVGVRALPLRACFLPLSLLPSFTTWSWISQPRELWKVHFCCLSHPVYGILLQQPKRTKSLLCFKIILRVLGLFPFPDKFQIKFRISLSKKKKMLLGFWLELFQIYIWIWEELTS